jgi:septal ring factor EnvC (AmiA/AmiB activator)
MELKLNKSLRSASKVLAVTLAFCAATSAYAAVDVQMLRTQINTLEKELLATKETQASAANQLKKIRKLLALQQKEISLSKTKVVELNRSMSALATQKQALLEKIETQKLGLKKKLRELNRLTEVDPLDASWVSNLEAENQKSYFLTKMLKKDLVSVERFKRDVNEALALELRILEEKNKLDYYVQDMESQMSMLAANEQIQKEIIRTNHASRLEVLRQVRTLKDSEREIERMLTSFKARPVAPKPHDTEEPVVSAKTDLAKAAKQTLADARAESIDLTLAALKGKLPFPVDGSLVSGFGKSYDPKTNLLTFQKGISLGAKPMAAVKAVAAGKVVFAGPLNNYGLIVIVEHPGQYYTLYGQMGAIASGVENGATVSQGDAVGRTSGEPFYFEIRNKNIAINPLQWLSSGSITLTKQ